jgi:hypothetical protein
MIQTLKYKGVVRGLLGKLLKINMINILIHESIVSGSLIFMWRHNLSCMYPTLVGYIYDKL